MNQHKNQVDGNTTLLQGIQNEVSAENAPLLEFITRHASVIAGVVVLLLLVLGGMAIWNWHQNNRQKETHDDLARINMQLKGKERDDSLARLAETAPDSTRMFIYMNLGKSAAENGNAALATQAYGNAAKLDADGALGLAAEYAEASTLLTQKEYAKALAILQELDARLPQQLKSAQLRQMLAEAAVLAGNKDLAIKTYQDLAAGLNTADAAYFRARAKALSEAESKDPKPASASTK